MTSPEPRPSRHTGPRTVNRPPNLIRSLSDMRHHIASHFARVHREETCFAPADPTRGEPVGDTMAATHLTNVYRSGHILIVEALAWCGTASAVSARLHVPALTVVSATASTQDVGEQELRLRLDLPPEWQPGDAYRVHVEAQRTSGADACTLRLLRAWQR